MDFLTWSGGTAGLIFLWETLGTFILITMGLGVCASVNLNKTHANNSGWVVIAFGWGLAVMVGAYVAFMSGAHLNPAVTFALWATGGIAGVYVPFYLMGQALGAFLGAAAVFAAFYPHFKATQDPAKIHGTFTTGTQIYNPITNSFTEIIATMILVLVILFLGSAGTVVENGFGPLIVGLTVVAIGLCLGSTTGYSLNPTRDLMPRLFHAITPIPNKGKTNWQYAYVPTVMPVIGGLIASGIYLLFAMSVYI